MDWLHALVWVNMTQLGPIRLSISLKVRPSSELSKADSNLLARRCPCENVCDIFANSGSSSGTKTALKVEVSSSLTRELKQPSSVFGSFASPAVSRRGNDQSLERDAALGWCVECSHTN